MKLILSKSYIIYKTLILRLKCFCLHIYILRLLLQYQYSQRVFKRFFTKFLELKITKLN